MKTEKFNVITVNNADLFLPGDKTRPLVLKNISLFLESGLHYVITGPNGSGKSTLLRMLAGEIEPCSGSVIWNNGNGPETSRIMAQKWSLLISPLRQEKLQKFYKGKTVAEFLREIVINCKKYTATSDQLIKKFLHQFDLLETAPLSLSQLSQGQLRAIMLIGALAARPKILLLDEALDGLDKKRKKIFLSEIKKLAKATTIILSTHRLNDLPDLNLLFLKIENGGIIKSGKPVIRKSIHQDNKLSVLSKTPFLCKLRNVNVFIDRKQILFDINLDLRKNENWLITGENGSGKSTLLRLIAGQEFVAYGGKFQWFSDDGTHNGIDIKKRIALVSDLSQINYDYPVSGLELVLSGLDNSTGNYREYTQKEKAQAISLINEFFTRQAPEKIMQTSIRRLSTGQLRKLFLARAVIGQPDLLLLDEAFNGLDETSRGEVIALINDIANRGFMDHKPGIIMTSHYEDDRPDCINRIAIMENGKLSNDLTL